jgi:DNA-directed RNA polymerase specialized sigma subunit
MLSKKEKEELILNHLYIAKKAATKFSKSPTKGSWDIEDLESVGKLALVKAANKFDPNNGTFFPIYARPWGEGNIMRYMNEQQIIAHMNYDEREDLNKIRTAINRSNLPNRPNRDSYQELSNLTKLSIQRIEQLLIYVYSETQELSPYQASSTFDENKEIEEEYLTPLYALIDSLPYREALHLKRKFGMANLSINKYDRKRQETINSSLLNRAFAKIRHPSRLSLVNKLKDSSQLFGGANNGIS